MRITTSLSGAVTGVPRLLIRLEGLALFVLAALMYRDGGHSWILFVAAFLAPDLSFAAYLMGPRIGAWGYNAAHTLVGPAIALVFALVTDASPIVGLIWAAHIGFDRTLGYGLKYPDDFGHTHLGRIGKQAGERGSPAT